MTNPDSKWIHLAYMTPADSIFLHTVEDSILQLLFFYATNTKSDIESVGAVGW
jgi:hypothetical protein